MKKYEIPKKLERLQDRIKSTIKPTVDINFERVECNPWDSKVGGNPYLEIGEEYPKTNNGIEYRLLAQINFQQMPKLEGYPERGLLQFFIEPDDMYGVDSYKIKYIENIKADKSQLVQDFSFLKELEEDWYMPFEFEGKMKFLLTEMPITSSVRGFENAFKDIEMNEDEEEALSEIYICDCRVGGYPYFTQNDPREGAEYDILLLQLDTEDVCEMMFGDSGVGNFFINSEDLKNCDFSKVLYTWDCC